VHQAVTSRRTPPAKRERRKRSAQGTSTNLKTYNYAARG
jgi:hypothetical protein